MLTATQAPARPALIYDGDCAFCREWADRVRRRDAEGRIELIPFQDQSRVARFGIPATRLHAAMHLVVPDGRAYAGAAAAPEILRRLPGRGTRWLARLFSVPGVPWAAARVYRWIARRRHRLACGSGVCTRGGGD